MKWYFNNVLLYPIHGIKWFTHNNKLSYFYTITFLVRTPFNIQYIHNSFYDYKILDGFLFHSRMLNALAFNRFGCLFYGGFTNSLRSPFLFSIFIAYRNGMRPKHNHTVDTLTASVLQCCSLIFFRLFSVQWTFIYIHQYAPDIDMFLIAWYSVTIFDLIWIFLPLKKSCC